MLIDDHADLGTHELAHTAALFAVDPACEGVRFNAGTLAGAVQVWPQGGTPFADPENALVVWSAGPWADALAEDRSADVPAMFSAAQRTSPMDLAAMQGVLRNLPADDVARALERGRELAQLVLLTIDAAPATARRGVGVAMMTAMSQPVAVSRSAFEHFMRTGVLAYSAGGG